MGTIAHVIEELHLIAEFSKQQGFPAAGRNGPLLENVVEPVAGADLQHDKRGAAASHGQRGYEVEPGLALLTGGWAVYLKLVEGVSFISTPLPLLVVMTGVTGFMCILMGLLAELLIRTYYEAQGKSVYLVGKTLNIKARCATRAARCVESSDL